MDSTTSPTTKPIYRATQVVWYLVGIVEIMLLFRFVFKLFGANSAAGFTGYVYAVTDPLTMAFVSVFRVSQLDGSMFEWTTILAMAVYALIGWGIVRLLAMSKTVSTPEAAHKLV